MKYAYILILIFVMILSGCKSENEKIERKQNKNLAVEEMTEAPKNEKKTEKSEQEEKVLLSESRTNLVDQSYNRVSNIKMASKSINGFTVGVGETFSFNNIVGERSEERGYKKAPIIMHQHKEYDYGGGVCQLSTTIYQAAKSAGLEITEHHNHKKEVNYAKNGEDAAVDYGTLDLKFKNNAGSQIIICSKVDQDTVLVQIYKKNS